MSFFQIDSPQYRKMITINNESPDWARMPKEQEYIECNFETVGKCPKCGRAVRSSIYHIDDVCKECGLKLWWGKEYRDM